MQRGEVIYWMTDMGWMMGPWLVLGSCLLGTTCVVHEGAPDFPGAERLWQMVENTESACSAFRRRSSGPSRHMAMSFRAAVICLRCGLCVNGRTVESRLLDVAFRHCGSSKATDHQLFRRHRNQWWHHHGDATATTQARFLHSPLPRLAADVVDERGNSVRNQVGELVVRSRGSA